VLTHCNSSVVLTGVVLASGCGPGGGPFDAIVARYDGDADRYEPGVERIATLDDPGSLSGGAARFRARGDVDLAVPIPASPDVTLAELREAVWGRPGEPVHPSLATSGDVVVARDFESFGLLTLYHHVEAAEAFFESAGAEPDEVEHLDVLYLPEARVGEAAVVDNAFYVFGARALVVVHMERLGDVPLAENEGVIAHEVGHALFDARVMDAEAVWRRLDPDATDTDPAATNLLDAMSEGTSDFLGAALTGDPDFLRHSVPSELVCDDDPACLVAYPRGLAERRVLEASWIEGAGMSRGAYASTMYRVGTTFASALWRASEDHAQVARALVAALPALGDELRETPPWTNAPASFGPAWLLGPIVSALDASTAAALCAIVASDLEPIAAYVSECAL